MLVLNFISIQANDLIIAKVNVVTFVGGTIEKDMETGEATKYYDKCIPVIALYPDVNNGYYVLVTGKRETAMGEEIIAVKLNVNVLEQNTEMAAVQSELLGAESEIIVSSSKQIDDGSRVKVVKDEVGE